ncbi:MAG: dTDP-4-dehydrorhamnose reductase [Deltaproteobacteria bacterium]|jgi:dTDP-4-dehydrorhamnose reductase|nr:dTDP-4-dehydrorhamnose reductase [Deltaproteobacteria bacterium]
MSEKPVRRLLVLGRNGQVGLKLLSALWPLGQVVALSREEADFADPSAVLAKVRSLAPQIIVNAAAWTQVDLAESRQDEAFRTNAETPAVLAEWAAKNDALFIHYSTDYVFNGQKSTPYLETDPVCPLNVYGASKLAGEERIAACGGQYLIFRTSWVFSVQGQCFPKTILNLAASRKELSVNHDQIGAPTSAAFLASATASVVASVLAGRQNGLDCPSGVHHLTSSGETSWRDFAEYLIRRAAQAGKKFPEGQVILPAFGPDPTRPAIRPLNSRLETTKFQKTFGLTCPPWTEQADHFLLELQKSGLW